MLDFFLFFGVLLDDLSLLVVSGLGFFGLMIGFYIGYLLVNFLNIGYWFMEDY